MHAKAIQKLIDAKPDKIAMAEWLAEQIGEIESINKRVAERRNAEMELRSRHAKEMSDFMAATDAMWREIRARCNHLDDFRYGDPRGGPGSGHYCNTCGKEL